ncbi:MAG TPA: AmmeMemoRadiSam system protein B [Chloroflexi bacterium]|jgi:AmmeMemoRadiSam system protein B|nr:AmmeMemoRadiSam system protein B [Chloroflexota bacterium]
MPLRSPIVAGMFYPAHEAACRREVEAHLAQASSHRDGGHGDGGRMVAGIVPHAGWAFSGLTAAHVFAHLRQQDPIDTVVLFGAVHSWRVTAPSVFASGRWRCPLAYLDVDEALAHEVLRCGAGALIDDAAAHLDEHSIEVQLPFLACICPQATILPIAVPPMRDADAIGSLVAECMRSLGRRGVAIGTTDLTHYGPRYGLAPAGVGEGALQWIHANDARVIDLMVRMRGGDIFAEVEAHRNACGAGAVSATIGYAAAMGATQGHLAHYTTSHEVSPVGPASDMVGYAAVVYWAQ